MEQGISPKPTPGHLLIAREIKRRKHPLRGTKVGRRSIPDIRAVRLVNFMGFFHVALDTPAAEPIVVEDTRWVDFLDQSVLGSEP